MSNDNANDKIVNLNLPWFGKIEADTVLNGAIGKLKEVLIIGTTEDGEEFYASTFNKKSEGIYLVERFKHDILSDKY